MTDRDRETEKLIGEFAESLKKKPIGAIVGDLICVLVSKKILDVDELKMIVGDAYFEELVKEADNGKC